MTNFNDVWTETRVEQLKTLWAKGLSCSQIAAELGGFKDCRDGGRSAVIGKVHRLKLPQPAGKKTRQPRSDAGPRPSRTPFLGPQDAPRLRNGHAPALRQNPSHNILAKIAGGNPKPLSDKYFERWDGPGITLMQLDTRTCRWPLGDPLDDSFLYCGDPSADLQAGHPYCPFHSRTAFDRASTTRSARRFAAEAAE